jgi:hypothetical protein
MNPQPAPEPISFDRAEYETPVSQALTCAECRSAIDDRYYARYQSILCPDCSDVIERHPSRFQRLVMAAGYGLSAAACGSVVYALIVNLTHFEFGLMAVFLGLLVGKAVRRGSGDRGGWQYQALAMAFTYVAICTQYLPMLAPTLKHHITASQWILLVLFSLEVPWLMGFQNVLGWLFIGFGLYQAWKTNQPTGVVSGPFSIAKPAEGLVLSAN